MKKKKIFKKLLLGKKKDTESQFYRDCNKFNLLFNK
jgi:hypothetical protein